MSNAPSPWKMPAREWFATLKRTWKEQGDDNIGLVAAGVAFYAFLAIVPLLAAAVLTYGLVATPETVFSNLQTLTTVMPQDAARLIGEQLLNIVTTSSGKKGLGLLLAIAVALFGARNGASSIITALNIVYEEKEKRGFIKLTLIALAMTLASVVALLLAVIAMAALSHLDEMIGPNPVVVIAGRVLSYALVVVGGAAGAATLYRYGPSRPDAKWTWLTPGSLLAALGWALLTAGFGFYVANFGNYNATYGSLGAVVVLLTWIYLSAYILLLGAELNAELERQTKAETTDEPGQPAIKRNSPDEPQAAGWDGGQREQAAAPKLAHARNKDRGSFAAQRVGIRAGRMTGGGKVGLLTPAAAALGLSWLKRGKAKGGLAVLAGAAVLAWLRRDEPDGEDQTVRRA